MSFTVFGGEGTDVITVATGDSADGTVTIFGGTSISDTADSADEVFVSGGGTFTIYGNGGADELNLDVTSTATLSAFGGVGNDTISLSTITDAASGSFTLAGGDGADSFVVEGSGTGLRVTISDFGTTDELSIGGVSGDAQAVSTPANATLQTALDAAADAAAAIGVVTYQGSTYVVVNNNGEDGFQIDGDFALKLTGVTNALDTAAQISGALVD